MTVTMTMRRFLAYLTALSSLAGAAPVCGETTDAAVLLLDIEPLCLRVGNASVVDEPSRAMVEVDEEPSADIGAQTGRERPRSGIAARALASATLAIVGELLEQPASGTEHDSLVAMAFDLERRICGDLQGEGPLPMLADRLGQVTARLAVRLEESQQYGPRASQDVVMRYLPRLDEAISRSLEDALRVSREGDGPRLAASTAGALRLESLPARQGDRQGLSLSTAGSASATTGEGGVVGEQGTAAKGARTESDAVVKVQRWNPDPAEMAQRREQKVEAFRARLASWYPVYRQELRRLAGLRSAISRELETRSLEHVRPLCESLSATVERIPYEMVLATPEPTVRANLVRMLGGYATAGRWCAGGRFAFAWIEIEKADRRWRLLTARLQKLVGQ